MTLVRSSPATGTSARNASQRPCASAARMPARGMTLTSVNVGATSMRRLPPAEQRERGPGGEPDLGQRGGLELSVSLPADDDERAGQRQPAIGQPAPAEPRAAAGAELEPGLDSALPGGVDRQQSAGVGRDGQRARRSPAPGDSRPSRARTRPGAGQPGVVDVPVGEEVEGDRDPASRVDPPPRAHGPAGDDARPRSRAPRFRRRARRAGGARDRSPGRPPGRRRSRPAVRPRSLPRAARRPPRIGPDRRRPRARRAPRPRRTTEAQPSSAAGRARPHWQARRRPTAAVEVEEETDC